MKYLTLVRHAKSSWDKAGLDDFDRPLNQRGLKNAPEMGKRLTDAGYIVGCIVSSPALRAISTAEMIAKELNFDPQQIIEKAEIYEASLHTLVNIVLGIENNLSQVMLVGHNPGFTLLCNYLSNANIDNLPTCSVAQLQFDVNVWGDIKEKSGKLIKFDYPKKITN